MGDPRKLRKKYSTPNHPWQKARIDAEKELVRTYGFKNKKEIWKMDALLSKFQRQVKALLRETEDKSMEGRKELLTRLQTLNLLSIDASIEDILSLELKDICERRLQSVVHKKGLARSMKQARQFITHQHIMIGGQKVTAPSYIVSSAEESMIHFSQESSLDADDHPERIPADLEIKKDMAEANIVHKEHVDDGKSAEATLKADLAQEKAELAKENKDGEE